MHRKTGQWEKESRLKKQVLIILSIGVSIALLGFIMLNLLKSKPVISDEPASTAPSEHMGKGQSHPSPLLPEDAAQLARREDCYTFLVAASDQASGNADTIMVVTFDTLQKKVGMVSIPRDTLINPEDGYSSYPKINSTYLKGVDNLRAAVSDLLGIPIDFYVTVDVKGFVKLIDAIGGIDFNIPIHMSYDDPVQDLYIHFEPGLSHLSGKDVLKVCRLRHNNDGTAAYSDSDIGRTKTQQQVLIAVAKKVLLNPQKINTYLEIFQEHVETDLTLGNALWLVEPFLALDLETDIHFATLPGDGMVSYQKVRYCYELYPDEVVDIVNELISPYTSPLSLEDMNLFSANQ